MMCYVFLATSAASGHASTVRLWCSSFCQQLISRQASEAVSACNFLGQPTLFMCQPSFISRVNKSGPGIGSQWILKHLQTWPGPSDLERRAWEVSPPTWNLICFLFGRGLVMSDTLEWSGSACGAQNFLHPTWLLTAIPRSCMSGFVNSQDIQKFCALNILKSTSSTSPAALLSLWCGAGPWRIKRPLFLWQETKWDGPGSWA